MFGLRQLIMRDEELTPRLKALVEQQDLEELEFEPGEAPDVDVESVDDLPVRTAGILDEIFGSDINLQSGVAETGEEIGWYEVEYPDSFSTQPIVIASSTHRDGEFNSQSFSSPGHGTPNLSFSAERISLENTMERNFKRTARDIGDRMYENGEDAFEAFLPTVATVDLSQPFVDAWDFIMKNTWGEGRNEKDGEGAVESVFGSLGEFMGRQIDAAINDKAGEIEDAIGIETSDGIDTYNSSVQSSYGNLSDQSEKALNESPKLLYQSIGMPEGALMTPVNVRNIDSQSFEVLGLEGGMTVHWVAVG